MTLARLLTCFGILVIFPFSATAADTDGDGLLDLIDAPGFDPTAESVFLGFKGIEDLDGVSQLVNASVIRLDSNAITRIEEGDFEGLSKLQELRLTGNQIMSIERDDFDGLVNLEELLLGDNQITSIESGAFSGMNKLQLLELFVNELIELNLTRATFENLNSNPCNTTFASEPTFAVDSPTDSLIRFCRFGEEN